MKTNPKSPRRKKKPEPVVDMDENIFNPFAPVLALFRRRGHREGAKKPRSFRHDFALVLLLHVIAILAFVAHGSIKRYNATQKEEPVSAKKQEKKSVVEEIVKSSPGSAPELIETEKATRPGQHALRAVHEADPFLPETLTKSERRPAPVATKTLAKAPAKKDPPQPTAKATPAAINTTPVVKSAAVAKQNNPSGQAPAPAIAANDANTRRAFLEATGRIEQRREPAPVQTAAEPEIRRAEPVVRPIQSATMPPSSEIRSATRAASLPTGAVVWSTQPLDETTMQTPRPPRNQVAPPSEYTVAAGDNLDVISKRLGVDYEQLAALNNLSSSRDLQVGRKLAVPLATGQL